MNDRYEKSLDGLRGIAILLVLMYHEYIASFGWIGVTLFFVLSGYLITKILLEEKNKDYPLSIKFKNFWVRRILRIFPLYFLYLFILLVVYLFSPSSKEFNTEIPFLLSYTFNLYLSSGSIVLSTYPVHHLWSLSVEEQFYLLYPFLIFFSNKKWLKINGILLLIIAVLFRFFYGLYWETHGNVVYTGRIYTHTVTYLGSFIAGASIIFFRFEKLKLKTKIVFFIIALCFLLVSGLFVYLDRNQEAFDFHKYFSDLGIVVHFTKWHYYTWNYLVLNIFFLSLLLLLVSTSYNKAFLYLKKLFTLKSLVAIGKVSYGMYIFHIVISDGFKIVLDKMGVHPGKYLFFFVYLIILYFFSFGIYQVFERQFLKLKEKFR